METICREVLEGFLEEVCGASQEENTRFQDSLLTKDIGFHLGLMGTHVCACVCPCVRVCMSVIPVTES